MKTNKEILEKVKQVVRDIVHREKDRARIEARGGAIRDGGPEMYMIGRLCFLEEVLEQKDKEWKEKMIEVLESLDLDTSDCDERDRSVYERNLCIEEAELWQQEQINKLKND